MKKFLTSFYRSHRIGLSAGKTLLWIWVKNDLPKIKGEIGIDLAGGRMFNKRFFRTKKYICVDIDENELNLGKKNNPDAIIINKKIQQFLKEKNQIKPNILVCFQTMGVSKFFEHIESIEVIKSMYEYLSPGGSMFFNIACEKNINRIEKELSNFLSKKFEKINFKYYGAFHKTQKKQIPAFFRLILAYSMYLLPLLRTMFGTKKQRLYYDCRNKY
jgi:threonine dehydrogenase-like Zn-dependent dehydrogenase